MARHMVCTWRKDICHVAGNTAALYFCPWRQKKPIRISICDLDSRVRHVRTWRLRDARSTESFLTAAQTRCHTAPGGNLSVTAKCEGGFNDSGKNISTKKQPEGGTGESQGIRSHLSGLPLPASPAVTSPPNPSLSLKWWNRRKKRKNLLLRSLEEADCSIVLNSRRLSVAERRCYSVSCAGEKSADRQCRSE